MILDDFLRRLRARGLAVPVTTQLDFFAAVETMPPSTVGQLYWIGAATLVGAPEPARTGSKREQDPAKQAADNEADEFRNPGQESPHPCKHPVSPRAPFGIHQI